MVFTKSKGWLRSGKVASYASAVLLLVAGAIGVAWEVHRRQVIHEINLQPGDFKAIRYGWDGKVVEVPLMLDADEIVLFDRWKETLWKGGFADFTTYLPGLSLESARVQVQFLSWDIPDEIIIRYKESNDPQAAWKQYSRNDTADDRKMWEIFRKLAK